MSVIPVRGQVYWIDIGHGRKPWVIVSNNVRNRLLPTVLAARCTTADKHASLPSWVRLTQADRMSGAINCDDIEQLERDELGDYFGALSPDTLRRLNDALKVVLDLP
jgi:mRNA interferase MazF